MSQPISPSYLSSAVFSPGLLHRISIPINGQQPAFRLRESSGLWGRRVADYGGTDIIQNKVDNPQSTHKHFGSGIQNEDLSGTKQPLQWTSLRKSACRLNDQVLPPVLGYALQPQPKPLVNPYFSHRPIFEVFPTNNPLRTSNGAPVLTCATRQHLEDLNRFYQLPKSKEYAQVTPGYEPPPIGPVRECWCANATRNIETTKDISIEWLIDYLRALGPLAEKVTLNQIIMTVLTEGTTAQFISASSSLMTSQLQQSHKDAIRQLMGLDDGNRLIAEISKFCHDIRNRPIDHFVTRIPPIQHSRVPKRARERNASQHFDVKKVVRFADQSQYDLAYKNYMKSLQLPQDIDDPQHPLNNRATNLYSDKYLPKMNTPLRTIYPEAERPSNPEPNHQEITRQLNLWSKTAAHHCYHQTHPDRIPDLRDILRYHRRYFYSGHHSSLVR